MSMLYISIQAILFRNLGRVKKNCLDITPPRTQGLLKQEDVYLRGNIRPVPRVTNCYFIGYLIIN